MGVSDWLHMQNIIEVRIADWLCVPPSTRSRRLAYSGTHCRLEMSQQMPNKLMTHQMILII